MKSFKYTLLIGFLLVSFWTSAANRYARMSGNWVTGNIWASTPGGVAGSAATPTSADDVYTNGFLVSTSSNVTCKNLFVSYNVAGSIAIGNLRTITITGTLNGWDDVGGVDEIPTVAVMTFGSGSSLTFTGANVGGAYAGYVIYFWDATAPLARVNFNFASNATFGLIIPLSFSTIVNINSGTLAPDPGSDLTGAAANLVIATGATLTTGDPVSFNNITIDGTLNTSSYVNTTQTFTMGTASNAGVLNTSFSGGNQTQGWWNLSSNPTAININYLSTVNYLAAANQNVAATQYGNLEFSGSGTKTVNSGGSVNIMGNLTFNSTLPIFTSSQTIVFNGPNGQTISGGGVVNFNGGVTINKTSGTLTVAEDINWQGVLNLSQVGSGVSFTNASTTTATGVASIVGLAPTFHSLAVSGSAVLTGYAGNTTLLGNFTNDGTYNANNGTLTFSGAAGQTISGTSHTTFANITSTNSLSLSINSPQSISDALTLSAGVLNANGNLTLLSSASRTARIAEITGGATISGNVNVQRYLPNTAGVRDYRFLASPVINGTVSQWKAAFPITGTFSDPSTSAEWPGISTPIISATPSMYLYNEAHTPTSSVGDRYEAYPSSGSSASNQLVNGQGYAAFVRQTVDINVISVTGVPKIGPATVNLTAQSGGGDDGWNLIGNPFASPISWDNVTLPAGVVNQISLLDNTNNSGGGVGNYVNYVAGVGGTNGYNGTIASGQAFFVRATSNATITFQEDDKVTTANPSFIREGSVPDLLRIHVSGNGRQDEMLLHFKKEGLDIADEKFDAFKMANNILNLSSKSVDGKNLAINTMGALGCDKEVSLVLDSVKVGSHKFTFSEMASFSSGVELTLVDQFTGKTQAITAAANTYEFNVTADVKSFGANRFKVKIGYPGVLTDLKVLGNNVCVGTDSQITVSGSQTGVNYYAAINGSAVSDVIMGNGNQLNINIPHAKLTKGDNQIVIMAGRAGCTNTALSQAAVVKTDNIYSVAAATAAPVCKEGEVTITASGAPADGSYRWYESSEAANAIAGQTSAVFKTASLNKTKTYYVSVVNSLGCEGARKEASARVVNFDDAAITQTGYATLQSNFETGNQWYLNDQPIAGATAKVLEVKESGVYKLKVAVEGTCETSANLTMVITDVKSQLESRQVYPNPVKDVLTIKLPYDKGSAIGAIQNELGQKIGQINFKLVDDFLIGEFNFEDKMPGLYIVRITQGNSVTNHKIVKK